MARITFALLLLATTGAVFFFGVISAWNDIRLLQAETKELVLARERLDSLRVRRDELTKEYNAIPAADLEKLSRMIPVKEDTARYLREMEALTGQHGMVLRNIDFAKADRESGKSLPSSGQRIYTPLSVSFSLQGTYASLRSFLADLERVVRVTDISELSFSAAPPSGRASGQATDYSLKGFIYHLRGN